MFDNLSSTCKLCTPEPLYSGLGWQTNPDSQHSVRVGIGPGWWAFRRMACFPGGTISLRSGWPRGAGPGSGESESRYTVALAFGSPYI